MTVSTQTSSVSYNGDGATVAFTVTFPFQANGDILATHRDADGVETAWVEDTQYTLTGAGDATGTLTVKTTPTDYTPAASTTLTIQRDMTFTQDTDYVANDPFPAESHEDALDKLTMIVQQLKTDSSLKVRFSSTVTDSPDLELSELAANRASKIFQFNAAGDTLELATALAGSTILDDDTMGAGTGSTTQAPSQDSVYNFATAEDTKLADGTTPFTAIDVNGGAVDGTTFGANATCTFSDMTITFGSDADGDIYYRASNKLARIAKGTHSQSLRMNTGATAPVWGSGNAVQHVYNQTGAVATGSTVLPVDDTIPQITEGDEYMTQAITPTNTNNILKIEIQINLASSILNEHLAVALFQDTTADALAAVAEDAKNSSDAMLPITLVHYMVAGTTSSTTFRCRAGADDTGTTTFNGLGAGRIFGGVIASSMSITEIAV